MNKYFPHISCAIILIGVVFLGAMALVGFISQQRAKRADARAPAIPVITFPGLEHPTQLAGGIDFYAVTAADSSGRRLWVYLPKKRGRAKVPCVFIAPAGSSCFTGMSLSQGDRAEHVPYVHAGYAVVAYDLDGPFDWESFNGSGASSTLMYAIYSFRAVEGGVVNGKAAIDFALANIPAIDGQRLYSAGHSSAGTVALLLAEKDPRIKACVAYAPLFNITEHTPDSMLSACEIQMPYFRQFTTDISPSTYLAQLTCPVFLFHADDDSIIGRDDVEPYVKKMRRYNPQVTYVTVPTGEHYDSMIDAGVPQAITWLQQLPK
ncbi:MAG TPA: prolyl oligopeptidase family serine peptidase [Armatimonadota bacterium]